MAGVAAAGRRRVEKLPPPPSTFSPRSGSIPVDHEKMLAVLTQHGLRKALSGKLKRPATMTDEQWDELDEKALSTIQLCLSREVLREVINATTAADIWSKLESLYMTKSLANKLRLKERLFTLRMKTCPLLLRVFTKIGGHHDIEEFAVRGKEPKNEFQIYTWRDATLRELTDLVKEVTPEARRRDARLSFAFVYPDKDGRFVVRPVGKTFSYGSRRVDDDKALALLGFQTGDYLDVAIF